MTEAGPEASKGPWDDDLLGRADDAAFLKRFLLARIDERAKRGAPRSYVLNLDAGWGKGKTYFLNGFARELRADGFLVAEVNAWRDDHADDPLVAVMAAIDDAVLPAIKDRRPAQTTWKNVKRAGAKVTLALAKGVVETAA